MENEQALVERAARGDRDAFRSLYEENARLVFGYLRARVGPNAAEDLTAETFCKAFEHMPGFEWRGVPFRAWLLRIANNLVIGRSRRRSSTEILVDDFSDRTPAVETDPTDAIQQTEVRAALESLPERQRIVIDLRYLRELSVGETATVLGLSEQGVRALTYRALKALREAYSGPDTDMDRNVT